MLVLYLFMCVHAAWKSVLQTYTHDHKLVYVDIIDDTDCDVIVHIHNVRI
jgi:hypothetical protein